MSKKFYSSNSIYGYPQPWKYTLGNRGAGKTYAEKLRLIRNFKKKGHQFVVLMRRSIDLDEAFDGFFNDIVADNPSYEITYKNNEGFIDGELAFYGLAIKNYMRIKRKSLPKVETIWFDEFLNEENDYLRNEFDKVKSIYQTIARGNGSRVRDLTMRFTANHASFRNPYFEGHGVRFDMSAKWMKGEDWVIESFHNEDAAREISESKSGKTLTEGKYGAMAQGSKFLLDSDAFIEKLPKNNRYLFTVKYDGDEFGVYEGSDYKYYISSKVVRDFRLKFVFSNSDYELDYIFIDSWRTSPVMQRLRLSYLNNKVFFTNQKCKAMWIEVMNYTE